MAYEVGQVARGGRGEGPTNLSSEWRVKLPARAAAIGRTPPSGVRRSTAGCGQCGVHRQLVQHTSYRVASRSLPLASVVRPCGVSLSKQADVAYAAVEPNARARARDRTAHCATLREEILPTMEEFLMLAKLAARQYRSPASERRIVRRRSMKSSSMSTAVQRDSARDSLEGRRAY